MDRTDDFEVVSSFDCGDERMVVINAAHGTHVMSFEEWELIKKNFVRNNPKSRTKRENIKVA
ncbi:MAG: hypothetical protein LBS02_03350 [Hungatella sp.]|nr:hypothetical protein [Hungatella sp.]